MLETTRAGQLGEFARLSRGWLRNGDRVNARHMHCRGRSRRVILGWLACLLALGALVAAQPSAFAARNDATSQLASTRPHTAAPPPHQASQPATAAAPDRTRGQQKHSRKKPTKRLGAATPTPPQLVALPDEPSRWLLDPESSSAVSTTAAFAAPADDPSIAGTVTDATTLAAVAAVTVSAYSTTNTNVFSATTDATGAYTIPVPIGSYEVVFEDHVANHIVQWWQNAATQGTARVISVGSGDAITGINAALAAGGSISGTVTDNSAQALAGICVSVYDAQFAFRAGGCTDAAGHYRTTGVLSGSYKVVFDDKNGPFLEEWYNNATSSATATPVAVSVGSVTSGIDASLAAGRHDFGHGCRREHGIADRRGVRVVLGAFAGDFALHRHRRPLPVAGSR